MNPFEISLLLALLLTIFVYVFYPFLLFIMGFFVTRKKMNNKNLLPRVSVIVPTYNEEHVIESKLQSLLKTDYPKYLLEVIVVDSGSTDNTVRIVEKFSDAGVTLLKQERRLGKANAINLALKKTTGSIVILTDANSEFQPNAIGKIVSKFDEDVGAVLPKWVPSGNLNLWDKVFCLAHHIYHSLESNTDSVFFVFGELFAFRKELISEIDEKVASDDLEIAFLIRRRDYKIKYAPDLMVTEENPASFKEVEIQKIRRIHGIIQVMKKNLDLLLNPKYGLYGLVIFPVHFLQITVQPFVIFYLVFAFMIKTVNLIFAYPLFSFPWILFCLLLIFVSTRVREILFIGFSFLATHFFMILAFISVLRGKDYHIWEKVSSTRNKRQE